MGITIDKTGSRPALKLSRDDADAVVALANEVMDRAIKSSTAWAKANYKISPIKIFRTGFEEAVRARIQLGEEGQSRLNELNKRLLSAVYKVDVQIEEIVELLDAGAYVNAREQHTDSTPLHYVVLNSRTPIEIIDLLINRGAHVDARDEDGSTPLHHAAAFGNIEAVKKLKSYGASLNVLNHEGYTPSSLAAKKGHKEIEELLKTTSGPTQLMDDSYDLLW